MKAIVIQTTCASKVEAKNISEELLNNNLAACIQMSNIESFYKWEGEFCNDIEVLLTIKTKKKHFEKIESKIKELHSYDVPEIIAIDINNMSKDYKRFISKNC